MDLRLAIANDPNSLIQTVLQRLTHQNVQRKPHATVDDRFKFFLEES